MEIPIAVNDKAPDFNSLDQDGNKIALKDFKGKWVVLYFYPRADTPGCTIEACSFRDSFKRVERIGAVVLGVSPDTPAAQKKFVDKFDLPFALVADADKAICTAYGVIQEKNMYGKKVMGVARTTFIIGPDGRIGFGPPSASRLSHFVITQGLRRGLMNTAPSGALAR